MGFSQILRGSDTRVVVTHGAFLVARVEVRAGRMSFPLPSGEILAGNRFIFLLPPRSVLPMHFDAADVVTEGVAGFGRMAVHKAAVLKDVGRVDWKENDTLNQILQAPVLHSLSADESISAQWVQARLLFHESLAHPAPVRQVARRLGITVETLSRGFSRAYGISAKQYCHRARLFEAVLRLAAGATIVESAFTAGFGDLKRFYEQFRRILGTTPGEYAHVKKRQDSHSGSPV